MEKNQIASSTKYFKKNILKIIFLLTGCLLILYFFLIPPIVKSYLVNSLRAMGLGEPRLTIRHVGSQQIDIQQLTLGDAGKPDLTIPSLAIDFSLIELIKGRVEKIAIAGMKLNVTAGKGGLTIKGLEALFKGKKTGKLVFPVRQLHIASSLANVDLDGRKIIVPFDLQAITDNTGETVVFSAALNPYGETIAIKGTLNTGSGDGTIKFTADRIDVQKYFNNFNVPFFQWFKSQAQLSAELKVNAWRISANRVSLVTRAFSAGFPGGAVTGALQLDCRLNREFRPEDIKLKLMFASVEQTDLQSEIPFVLDISGSQLGVLKFRLSDLKLQRPPGIAFKNFFGTASLQNDQLQIQGSFGCGVDTAFFNWLFPAIQMQGKMAVSGAFQIVTNGQRATWNLKGAGRGKVALAVKHDQAKAAGLAFSFAASNMKGNLRSDLDLEFKAVEGKYRDLVFSARNIHCQNTMAMAEGQNWSAGGRLQVADAALKQTGGLAAEGLFIDMPWHYPPPAKIVGKKETFASTHPGNWRIASLKIGDLNLGKTTGAVKQKEQGIEFIGEARTPVEPLKIKLTGSCQWRDEGIDASLRIAVPETQIAKNSQLQGLHPALADYRCSGFLSASGTIAYVSGELKSQAKIRIRDWAMAGNSAGLNCQGMNMIVNFKDLVNIRSEFSQRLDFKLLNISGLQLNQGDLLFEIDGTESLYIEGGEFAFSGGRILLQPLRYNFQRKELKITLYSERINFAQMLNTLLGEKIASGDAELNGLLTVDMVDGIPVFRNGYLYSTPGVGGNIKFTRSEAISGGVLLVEEAARDFNYDWIKVKLDTAKENLNVIAFINGVPVHKLPLTYDSKSKDIIRDPSGKRNLELKGLLLELRFTDIDLKGLMKSGAKINFGEKKLP